MDARKKGRVEDNLGLNKSIWLYLLSDASGIFQNYTYQVPSQAKLAIIINQPSRKARISNLGIISG